MSIALEDIVVGEEYEGVINNVVTYGAFVDIGTEVSMYACMPMMCTTVTGSAKGGGTRNATVVVYR